MRKICVITGSRAEYGILRDLMKEIDRDPSLSLQVIVTNMHLSPEFGLTYREIEKDGLRIDRKVEMLLSSDSPVGTAKSLGLGVIGMADALAELNPDMVVILGDRYEMLGAAEVALILGIPLAHLHGGEVTEGAYDDAIRHAITKLADIHLTATEEYRRNVIQMGEDPGRVFNVGALGVDNIIRQPLMDRAELSRQLDFDLYDPYLSVTFHPVTREHGTAALQTQALLNALSEIIDTYKIIITLPNSDTDGRVIMEMFKDFASDHPDRVLAVTSLGRDRYFASLKYASAVVGNSSSGLIEAPAFGIPTLNIGNRQKGRARGASVVDVAADEDSIRQGLEKVLSPEFAAIAKTAGSPYYQPETLAKVKEIISSFPLENIKTKHFHKI